MFEREIKFIYDFNLNKVKKTGSFLTYEQLLAADMHPAIMQYISAEIDYLIFEDRQKMLKNSVFDYSGGKITQYFNLISQEVKKSKRFSTDYISKLILHASSFTVNFLIRPKWSLLKFIYDEDENKTSAEIKQILNYLYYYGYLKNILISYLDKKKILSMNKEEFADLLEKIEKLGVETYLDDVLNTALKSMAEFFNIGTTQKTRVPVPGIHIFLKEKKLTDHINRLNNYFGTDEKINQEIKDVQKVLMSVKTKQKDLFEETLEEEDNEEDMQTLHEEVIETSEEEINKGEELSERLHHDDEIENEEHINVKEEIEENTEEEIEQQNEADYETPGIENEHLEDENQLIQEDAVVEETDDEFTDGEESMPLEENLAENIEDKTINEIEEENKTAIESPIENEVDEKDQDEDQDENEDEPQVAEEDKEELGEDEPSLFGGEEIQNVEQEERAEKTETQITAPESEVIKNSTIIDMSEILEHKNMTKIIENVFDYDMEDFANTIDMISECPSKAEALQLISELFENNNIKPNSKEAETFKSIISEYFDKAQE